MWPLIIFGFGIWYFANKEKASENVISEESSSSGGTIDGNAIIPVENTNVSADETFTKNLSTNNNPLSVTPTIKHPEFNPVEPTKQPGYSGEKRTLSKYIRTISNG